MNKNWVVLGSFAIGLLLFGYILGDINISEAIDILRHSRPLYLLGYLALTTTQMLGLTLAWKLILKARGKSLDFFTLFNYRMVDYAISYLTPGPKIGGEYSRASLLHKHGMSMPHALSSCVLDKAIQILVNSLYIMLGTIGVTLLVPLPKGIKITLYALSLVFLVAMILFFAFLLWEKRLSQKVARIFRIKKTKSVMFEDYMIKFCRENKKLFWTIVGFSLPRRALQLFELKLILLMLGVNMDLAAVFFLTVAMGIAEFFLVPMSLGTLEASQISAFAILSQSSPAALLLSLIIRLKDLSWSAWGIMVLGYHGLNIKEFFGKTIHWFNGSS